MRYALTSPLQITPGFSTPIILPENSHFPAEPAGPQSLLLELWLVTL